jgi:hypothetical protein
MLIVNILDFNNNSNSKFALYFKEQKEIKEYLLKEFKMLKDLIPDNCNKSFNIKDIAFIIKEIPDNIILANIMDISQKVWIIKYTEKYGDFQIIKRAIFKDFDIDTLIQEVNSRFEKYYPSSEYDWTFMKEDPWKKLVETIDCYDIFIEVNSIHKEDFFVAINEVLEDNKL